MEQHTLVLFCLFPVGSALAWVALTEFCALEQGDFVVAFPGSDRSLVHMRVCLPALLLLLFRIPSIDK